MNMSRKAEKGNIYYGTKKAGELRKTPEGYEFRYDEAYLNDPTALPVSLALPLRREPYRSDRLFPFFEGLLPEGWLRDLTCSTLKIDKNDDFRLLLATCGDTAGAVSVVREPSS